MARDASTGISGKGRSRYTGRVLAIRQVLDPLVMSFRKLVRLTTLACVVARGRAVGTTVDAAIGVRSAAKGLRVNGMRWHATGKS